MQSQRKKLGQFNQIPMSDIKYRDDSKYKEQKKYQPKQHLFSRPYQPEVQTFPHFQQIIRFNQFGLQFHHAFPLLSDPYNTQQNSQQVRIQPSLSMPDQIGREQKNIYGQQLEPFRRMSPQFAVIRLPTEEQETEQETKESEQRNGGYQN